MSKSLEIEIVFGHAKIFDNKRHSDREHELVPEWLGNRASRLQQGFQMGFGGSLELLPSLLPIGCVRMAPPN